MATPKSDEWYARFFDPVFFDADRVLTRDPAAVDIARDAHPLVPVVSLIGDGAKIPPKGLILAPMHMPRLLNDPAHGPSVIAEAKAIAKSIRSALTDAYGPDAELKHLVWAGMGGSIEDKFAAIASGLAQENAVQFWGVDDVNRDTLAHILSAIAAEEEAAAPKGEPPLKFALKRTVVVAQALGMTSVEPVFNVQKAFAPAYERHGLSLATHFYKVTIPGSLLDQALAPPVVNIPHQPFGLSTCAGRHDYVSNGMLVPLELLGASPEAYAKSLNLDGPALEAAFNTAEWLARAQAGTAAARKEAVVLLLPREWRGAWHARPGPSGALEWRDASLWFKQHVEESLGKAPDRLLKVVTSLEGLTDASKQLALVVRAPGLTALPADGGEALRAAGADVRTLDLPGTGALALGALFQTFTVIKYRLAEVWGMCAVNQPPVECYKRIVAQLEKPGGGAAATKAFFAPDSPHTASAGGVSVSLAAAAAGGGLPAAEVAAELASLGLDGTKPADLLGAAHRVAMRLAAPRRCYGEAIYFGNLTRGAEAKELRTLLEGAFARSVWAEAAKSFADVGKGPGVGHATHAMGKQGGVLTLSILPDTHDSGVVVEDLAGYPDSYQENNAYANVLALAGFDVADSAIKGGVGHPGMVAFVRIARNDEAMRATLAAVFKRVAEIVGTEVVGMP